MPPNLMCKQMRLKQVTNYPTNNIHSNPPPSLPRETIIFPRPTHTHYDTYLMPYAPRPIVCLSRFPIPTRPTLIGPFSNMATPRTRRTFSSSSLRHTATPFHFLYHPFEFHHIAPTSFSIALLLTSANTLIPFL